MSHEPNFRHISPFSLPEECVSLLVENSQKMKGKRLYPASSDDPRIMKTCCCCLDVRLGTIVLGFLHLVSRCQSTSYTFNTSTKDTIPNEKSSFVIDYWSYSICLMRLIRAKLGFFWNKESEPKRSKYCAFIENSASWQMFYHVLSSWFLITWLCSSFLHFGDRTKLKRKKI